MFEVKINTGGAAFHDPYGYDESLDRHMTARELQGILSSICNSIRVGRTEGACIDINGNKCGTWKLD